MNMENNAPNPANQGKDSPKATQAPSKITPPVVTPYDNTPKKIRPSEVVIILAIIFGCIICGLLVWGVIAIIQHFPVWWHNIFGMAQTIFIA